MDFSGQQPKQPAQDRPFWLVAAPHTPMFADGRLNLSVVPHQAQWLVDSGVDAAFVAGSTGEGQTLSVAERKALAESWVDAGRRSGLEVIMHIGHNSQIDACDLAEHAGECGADGIGAHSCYFTKPRDMHQLVDFCKEVAGRAGHLPFYYYHIPALTGVSQPMSKFLVEAAREIPSFAGIKFTHHDLVDLQECIRLAGSKYRVMFGWDEALVAGLALGVRAAVGSTYNFLAPHFRQLIQAADRGDLVRARELQHQANDVIAALQKFEYPRAAKIVMQRYGCECGPPRPPALPLTAAEQVDLMSVVSELPALADRPASIPGPHFSQSVRTS